MKIKVTCGCGSAFLAPEHMKGQTVRCPSCKKPVTVTVTPKPNAPEPELDLGDLTSLDQPSPDGSSQGSTVGRTALGHTSMSGSMGGSKIRRAASDKSQAGDQAVTQELDDRMTRMYEVYSGKKIRFGAGSGGSAKLLIGLGIAAVTIGLGIAVGWHVLKTEYSSTLDSMGDMISGTSSDDSEAAANLAVKARSQNPDAVVSWRPAQATQQSGAQPANTQIQIDAHDESRLTFQVRIEPESKSNDRRLSMATSVILYRALNADGEFTQADQVNVEGFDSATGSLTFELFDAEMEGHKTNQLHYRLSGFDSDGKRLFDTPAAGFAYVSTPVVKQGRVLWTPRAADQPLPAIRIGARLDAPGWEEVLLWQVIADGPIDQSLPDLPAGLPMVVESAVYRPIQISLDAQGQGRWQMRWVGHELDRLGKPGTPVIGAAPFAHANRLDYRITPDDKKFTSVKKAWDQSGKSGVSRVVMFTPKGGTTLTTAVVTPPVLSAITATAYNGRVHLSWNNAALLSGLDQYAGQVQIAIRRTDEQGSETFVAQLPTDSTGFTDTDVAHGMVVSYEVSLVQARAGGADPMVRADAWVQGHGALPVLTAFPFTSKTARVAPEPALDRLYVSWGINELSYAGTGLASVALQDHLIEQLIQTPGVAVVDRASQRCFIGTPAMPGINPELWGTPAQVQLRIVDSTTSKGGRLSLWATDLATGQPRLLARANASEAVDQADLFATKLKTYLESRMPNAVAEAPDSGDAPSVVVVGPIYPVDQPALYYQTAELAEQLAHAGDQSSDELAVVSRRFWLQDTQQDLTAIDHSGLRGAVLVVGRAWTSDHVQPGVSLRAIDAASGQLIASFESDRLTPQAVQQFADWCASLRALPDTGSSEDSLLLTAEASLSPIHPAWRQATSDTTGLDRRGSSPLTAAPGEQGATILSFGLPLPPALVGQKKLSQRHTDHPLYMFRPYVAPQYPLAFDDWIQAYANYIEADSAAFILGFEQIRRVQQANPGEFSPHLIVRGEHQFIGDGTIPAAAGGLHITPAALNTRTFFPMGVAQQSMVDYHRELSQAFKGRPWMMSHAWKQVNTSIADPFLRCELFGVSNGRYGRLAPPDKPVSLDSYIVASLLTDLGNREAYTYKQKSLEIASQALAELVKRGGAGGTGGAGGASLNAVQMKWATDALLVLIYEKDPGTITRLADHSFRERYFSVEPKIQGDVLRMLVDRAGPMAWEWADDFDAINWDTFCWRSRDEMDAITRTKADLIPEDSRLAIRAWLEVDNAVADDGTDITAVSLDSQTPNSN